MPTYEYACRDCGEHLEVVQSFKDDPLTECPNCQGDLRKVFSAAGIIFKGSGWHIKDYSAKKTGSASKTDSTAGSGSGSGGDAGGASTDSGSSDTGGSKSESKSESKSA